MGGEDDDANVLLKPAFSPEARLKRGLNVHEPASRELRPALDFSHVRSRQLSRASATPAHSPSRRFGRFELQPAERRLLEDGRPVVLGARAFDLLVMLVERAGQLVAKNDLLMLVWPGLVVEENNLQVQISALRKVLGQSAVATVPGRGYRFELSVEPADAFAAQTARSKPATAAAAPGPLRARTNLPAGHLSLYGRAQDLATIKALLRKHVVVTIVGAGGIGKTRVAQAVAADIAVESAADFRDGVWWVELAALSDGALVPTTVAHALGVKLPGDRPAVEAAVSLLASQRLLLVLDNCEHLAESVAEFVESVRAAAPQVRILVTSQETLKTVDEHIYRLGGLTVPVDDGAANALQAGAIELFVARAQGADPNFALTPAQAPAVIEICRRLDGIPLAIELAAARLPLLGVEGLRTRLDERFNILTAGARVVLRRHQTLRSTLEWSHGLLTAEEQTVFRRLGVFAGSFTLEAAQHVVSDERIDMWAALDHLGALVDKSLVLAEGDPVPRYRLLETTRAYALERLAEAGETERMLRRHAEAILALLAAYEKDDRRWRKTPADTAPLVAEIDNLRAALAWVVTAAAGADLVIPLAGVSYHVWAATIHAAEGFERCLSLRQPSARPRSGARRCAVLVFGGRARLGDFRAPRRLRRGAAGCRALPVVGGRQPALRRVALRGRARQLDAGEGAGHRRGGSARTPHLAGAAARPTAICPMLVVCAARPLRGSSRLRATACGDQSRGGTSDQRAGHDDQRRFNGAAARAPEAALEHGRAAIAQLDALGAGAFAGVLLWTVTVALIFLNRLDEAVDAARTARRLLLREGDERRLLAALALLAASQGRFAAAARVIGFDDAVLARTGEAVRPVAALLRARLDVLLDAALPAPELARLRMEGAALRDEQVFQLGFGDDA